MTTKNLKPHLAVAAIFALIVLPFVGKPFHVDDPTFLTLGQHAGPNPLELYNVIINWRGIDEKAFDSFPNPPLGPLYLGLLSPLAGDREWIYHMGFWPFLAMTLFAAYRLGRRFAPDQAGWTVVWTAVAPAVVIASHTVMPDIPLLAFYATGVALAVEGLDGGSLPLACCGGLIAGLSALFRYSGMTVIPLLLLYIVLHRSRTRIGLAAIVASAAPISVWTWLSVHVYGRIHWLTIAGFEGQSLNLTFLGHKLVYQLATLGLAIGIAAGIAALPRAGLAAAARAGGLLGGIGAILLSWRGALSPSSAFLLVAGFVVSGALLGHAMSTAGAALMAIIYRREDSRATDDIFLVAWLLGILVFNLWLLFAAARYLLLAQIPTVLLFQRLAAEKRTSFRRNAVAAAVALSLSLVVAAADQQFAKGYRAYASSIPPLSGQRWFAGTWGLQQYLERAGARPIGSGDGSRPRPGDEIVIPTYAWPQNPPLALHAALAARTVLPASIPLRTFTVEGRACFYSNILAPGPTIVWLPFGFSTGPLEVLTRWEVLQ